MARIVPCHNIYVIYKEKPYVNILYLEINEKLIAKTKVNSYNCILWTSRSSVYIDVSALDYTIKSSIPKKHTYNSFILHILFKRAPLACFVFPSTGV